MNRIRLGILLATAGLLLAAGTLQAEQYHGNGNTGFGGAIGNGTLTLTDDGTNISGTLAVGGSMNDVLVLYIQSGTGGFADTSGFNDQADSCRQAISGVSASGRSLLTFAGGFQPNYATTLSPTAAGTGGLWQLANGGNNSLGYLGSVNLAPLNNTGPYTFSFPAALIGMIPGVRSTIQICGTYVRTDGYRSTEAIAGSLTGTQGWNPFTQTAYANFTFDAGAVLVKLPLGVWAERASGAPVARAGHTAVWTGSEMIVWGGGNTNYLNDGDRYNAAANSWMPVTTKGAPAARSGCTAVWTGSEMIVWGGERFYNRTNSQPEGFHFLNDGGRYNPAANSWTAVATNGAPAARQNHTAIWTGSEMIVWGGTTNGFTVGITNDGGRYNPADDSWTAVTTNGAPTARENYTAVWTGSEMIIWGGDVFFSGEGRQYRNDGGRYNPAANTWSVMATNGAPGVRGYHTAVWTGSEMIVWGGFFDDGRERYLNDGGRYNPAANSWTAVTTKGAPSVRSDHTAVWSGNEMIVWGGEYEPTRGHYSHSGGRYNPAANRWTPVATTRAPSARERYTAVWTGSEMILWGGQALPTEHWWDAVLFSRRFNPFVPVRPPRSYAFNDGGRYNPVSNSWTPLGK